MIVIIEKMHEGPYASLFRYLQQLEPRRVYVDMVGPQATYLQMLLADGFEAVPLPKSMKARIE